MSRQQPRCRMRPRKERSALQALRLICRRGGRGRPRCKVREPARVGSAARTSFRIAGGVIAIDEPAIQPVEQSVWRQPGWI